MRVGYVSDIHLEFGYGDLTLPGGNVLLLAGDIVCLASALKTRHMTGDHVARFIDLELSKYDRVYMVMGNHEHYHGNIDKSREQLAKLWTLKVTILENESVLLEPGLRLWAATLWTDYDSGRHDAMEEAHWSMNDHRLIAKQGKDGGAMFTPLDAWERNITSRVELTQILAKYPSDKFVVMTHHTPSFKCADPRWGGMGNKLNFAFHNTGLDEFIEQHPQILHWVAGHTHDSFEGKIGSTQVHINPRGYINPFNGTVENRAFDANKAFEISTDGV